MAMDLERITTFLAVVEEGSLTGAARRRHVTQPAVSLSIRTLEEEMGTALLHRRGRGVVPTEAGTILARRAREILAALRSAHGEIAELAGLARGTVRVGVTDAAATGILPRAFAAFHRAHPGVEVRVNVHATSELVERLGRGEIDLAVGTLPEPRGIPGLSVEALVAEPLDLVVPRALKGRPMRETLGREPFIAYPSGSVTRRLVDAALAAAGAEVRPAMEIGRPDVMIRLVEAGLGVAVLPRDVSEEARSRGRVHLPALRGFRPVRRLGLLLVEGRALEPAARVFAEALRGDARRA